MRAQEAQVFKNLAATPALFPLRGGKYGVDVNATFGVGNVHFQKVAADGSTLVDVGSSTNFTAAGIRRGRPVARHVLADDHHGDGGLRADFARARRVKWRRSDQSTATPKGA